MRQPPSSFQFRTDFGIDHITVDLWDPPDDPMNTAKLIASFYMSTWDDPKPISSWYGDEEHAWSIAQDACSGKVLPNTLESVALTYAINGIARATTHQLVRTRVGAVFGQQGGRDNNWSGFNLRLSPTWVGKGPLIREAEDLQIQADRLYHRALESGIPYQDARYILPMGLETALVSSYNLLSLKSLAERRLCNRMMWETNYVVRLMCDLAVLHYPFIGRNLRSSCEKRGVCGSVSPMFPPSCWAPTLGEDMHYNPARAKDNGTLMQAIALNGYDFPINANANEILFSEIDKKRIKAELEHKDVVLSLSDGETVLASQADNGLWKSEGVISARG